MTTEVKNNQPDNAEKEKEMKEDPPADNGQTKEVAPAGEKGEDKPEEKKAETPALKPTVHKANYEKDVVYLYQFSRTPVLPSTSPYCLKLETWLRLAGIKYENVDHKSKFRSKKGQLPFVELNGEEFADSAYIIKELSQKFGKDLDASLTAEQRLVSHAVCSMIENHFSWVVLWWRAKYPDSVLRGYQLNLQSALNTRLPNPLLNFCYKLTSGRKGMKKARAHGIGIHTEEEIIELGKADLRVISGMLADKPFMFGNEPTILDVVVFANLAQLQYLSTAVEHPLRDAIAESFSNLAGLVARVQEHAFPDWDELIAAEVAAPPAKQLKDKENKEVKEKEAAPTAADTAAAEEKAPPADELEKGKGDEKEKEQEKEPEEKNGKDTEKEK